MSRTCLVPPLLPVVGAGLSAPLVQGGSIRYANLDHAASTPALEGVAAHLVAALPYYSSVHRGTGYASQVSTDLYEAVRPAVRRFTGARDEDAVVVVRGTTEALNLLASAVPRGGRVAVLDLEHHANLLPWRAGDHVQIPAADTLAATLVRIRTVLEDQDIALLTVTGASNVTGDVLPLAELAELAHANGARLAVDAAQLAPHRRLQMAAWGVDYLAFSGHKIYAPFGAGVLVGRADWLDDAPVHLAGGGAVVSVTADDVQWASGPARHEAGSPNVLGAAALAEACRLLLAIPDGELEEHERVLSDRLRRGLAAIPGVQVLELFPDTADRVGVVSFLIAGLAADVAAAALAAEHGIGVRDGRFCAHPLLGRIAGGQSALRASVGVASSSDDVERLLHAVADLAADGPRWTYAQDPAGWLPSPDPRGQLNPLDIPEVPIRVALPCEP